MRELSSHFKASWHTLVGGGRSWGCHKGVQDSSRGRGWQGQQRVGRFDKLIWKFMLGICVVFLFVCAFLKAISEIQFRMQILLWYTLRDLPPPTPGSPHPLFWPLLRHTNPQIKLHPALLPHLLGIYERNESEAAQWENFEELMGQFTHHLFLPLHLPLSYLHLNAMQAGESLFLSLCLCARFLLDFHIIWILIEIKAAARVLHA